MSEQPTARELGTTQHVRAAIAAAYAQVTDRAEAATTMSALATAARLYAGLVEALPHSHSEERADARSALALAILRENLEHTTVDDHLAVIRAVARE